MKKVAVFGNAGGGKSTLSKQLATITNLPLYVLDKIKYRPERKPALEALTLPSLRGLTQFNNNIMSG